MSSLNATTSSGIVATADNTGTLQLQSAGTTSATFNSFGIGLGSATPSSGIGITFPAAKSPSANANTLDDYEEGTWTPVYSAGTINGAGKVYSGTYTKIGRLVTVTFRASSTDANLQVVGYVAFTGLPFTAEITSSGAVTTEDIDIFARNGFCQTNASTTIFYLSTCGSAGGTNALFASTTYSI